MQGQNVRYKVDLKRRCYYFSLKLIRLVDTLPATVSTKIISNQLIRSGTSIGANLIEASASSSRLEFKKFHEIALKSANETQYWLELLRDSKKVNSNKIDVLTNEVIEISKMIASGILKLKGKRL